MEENSNGDDVTSSQNPNGSGEDRENSEPIKNPEGYDRKVRELLGSVKKLKDQLDTVKTENDSLRKDTMLKEGKKDEYIKTLETDVDTWKNRFTNATGHFLEKSVKSSFDKVAYKLGAKKPDILYRVLKDDVYENLGDSIDKESFSIDEERLTNFIEDKKKGDFSDFFKLNNVKVHDVSPNARPPKKKVNLDLNSDEAWEQVAKEKGW